MFCTGPILHEGEPPQSFNLGVVRNATVLVLCLGDMPILWLLFICDQRGSAVLIN